MTQVRVGGGSGSSSSGTLRQSGSFVGSFDPAEGLPTTGNGKNNRILKGDFWRSSGSGTIAGVAGFDEFAEGDLLYALINNAVNASDFFAIPGAGL